MRDTYPRPRHGWTCFHCGEHFKGDDAGQAAAQEHFGETPTETPACKIDIAHVRWLEEQHRRAVDDDTEVMRTFRSMISEHEVLRRRAEEEGYARGLADAQKHPEELGLCKVGN